MESGDSNGCNGKAAFRSEHTIGHVGSAANVLGSGALPFSPESLILSIEEAVRPKRKCLSASGAVVSFNVISYTHCPVSLIFYIQ